jgi:hypothetical protein
MVVGAVVGKNGFGLIYNTPLAFSIKAFQLLKI